MKRPRDHGGAPADGDNDDNEDDDNLAHLLASEEGFAGVDDEEEEARRAELRRQQRRERLAKARAAADDDPQDQDGQRQQRRPVPEEEKEQPQPQQHIAGNGVVSGAITGSLPSSSSQEEPTNKHPERQREIGRQDDGNDDNNDDFDMFSSQTPVNVLRNGGAPAGSSTKGLHVDASTSAGAAAAAATGHQEDFDDAEGYYKAVIGEVIELDPTYKLRVAGVIGKGVFSTVLKCHVESLDTPKSDAEADAADSSSSVAEVVALKCVRHNETMAKAALQEIQFLQQLSDAPSGIVRLVRPSRSQPPHLYYRGHVVMVMTYREYNLRTVLHKFGRGVGLSLTAVKSYFCQLLSALLHLQAKGILHADIKPDNILVSSDFDSVQLGDFGSAMSRSEQSSIPTPYLVSRFYRAPEIIMGIVPLTHGIDLWSLAVSIAELFTGTVLFRGRSNNEMLKLFQQVLRVVFPNRLIRQHLRECDKHHVPAHFVQQGTTFLFQQQTIDPVTKLPYMKHVHLQQLLDKTPSLPDVLYKAAGKQQGNVGQLADLLHRCMALDPAKRIDLRSALKHEFFQQVRQGGDGKPTAK